MIGVSIKMAKADKNFESIGLLPASNLLLKDLKLLNQLLTKI